MSILKSDRSNLALILDTVLILAFLGTFAFLGWCYLTH